MPLTQGQILNNRYRIVKLLGRGGMGDVYKAWDLSLSRPCALKESLEFSPEGQHQFMREAQILAGLHHPNLPRVTDHFNIPGQGQYLVMDFVEGKDLEELRLQSAGRLPEAQVLDWMMQVLDALNYMHRQRQPVIHRDIKPANIKIAPPDETYPQGRAMLVDFGIAKIFDQQKSTTQGARAVTPGYSPFEQYGTSTTDVRTDLYALGATLYTLLTGQEPPEAPKRIVRDPLIPPRQLYPGISPALEAVLFKALQIDPDARFQSAGEFKAGLSGQLPAFTGQSTVVVTQPPVPLAGSVGQPHAAQGAADGIHSSLTPATLGIPLPPITRPFPWKWFGLVAGLLAGLVLVGVLTSLAYQEIRSGRLTQTSQARASQTAAALAAVPTTTPSPLPPSITPTSQPPSLTPTLQPPSLTPTSQPPSLTYTAILPTATRTPQPPSPTHTPTYTPSPIPTPIFTAVESMFCRAGPDESYEPYTMVEDGETVPVLARWYANNWLLVGIDKSTTRTKCCWVGGLGDLNVSLSVIGTINFLPARIECDLTP